VYPKKIDVNSKKQVILGTLAYIVFAGQGHILFY